MKIKKEVLTTANITKKFKDGTECNLTPLGYAMDFNDFEEIIKVIVEASEDKKEVLTTANITEKFKDGTEYNLTPLGYAMDFNNFEEKIKVIVEASEDKKEVLTTANITKKFKDGTECNLTPLGYAMNFNNFEEKIKVIVEASEDKKEVLTTANITEKFKDGTEYNLTPLAYAMDFNNPEKKIKTILDVAKEKGILKEVLTTIVYTLKDGEYTTLLGYAIAHNQQESIEAIIGVAKEDGILKEVLNDIGRDGLKSIKSIFKETKDQDTLNEIYQIEKSRAVNKAMKVGSVCGVIAALAVGGGCFAAGIQLPILALIGIAVAAALVIGLIAGGITYAVSKPSNELNGVDAQPKVSSELGATA